MGLADKTKPLHHLVGCGAVPQVDLQGKHSELC
jgi:hypothetical protein